MIKNYRPGATQVEIEESSDVRFEEFVKDILAHQQSSPSGNLATVGSEPFHFQTSSKTQYKTNPHSRT